MRNLSINEIVFFTTMAASIPLTSHATDFIQNGSFEMNTAISTTSDHTFMYYNPALPTNKDSITDWTISNAPMVVVDYYNNASATAPDGNWYTNTPNLTYALPTSYNNVTTVPGNSLQPGAVQIDPDGGYFLGLDGNVQQNPGSSSVSQTVTGLTVGQTYTLTFSWAAVQLNAEHGPTNESFDVTFGDPNGTLESQSTPTVSICSHCFSGWMQSTMSFVADSTSQDLTFHSLGTPYGQPPMTLLDGVSMTQAVPEPASWAILLLGGVFLGGYGSYRRRSGSVSPAL